MSKVVNDDYPGQAPMSDADLKQMVLNNHVNTGTPDEFTKGESSNVPTEVIPLPSKGRFYPEGHPLRSGTIEMKYMTAKEEDILASQNLIKQGVVIDKLLQSLIVTRINYNDLLTVDKNAIFIAARILAYGPDYTVEIACPSCGEKSKHTIDLQQFSEKAIDWNVFEEGEIYHKFNLPVSKNVLTLQMLSHGDEKKIEEAAKAYKKASKTLGVDRELTTRLKHVIVAVDDNEDKAFINKFVDTMFSRDSLALRQHLKQVTPDIDTTFGYECPACGYEVPNMQLPIDVGFFWPGV
jgi:DNA-directed RNA polymerase subunit RPC12/RpoP